MYNETYLAHFGIKGMKWGVRRYRDKDGNLTASGRARYTKSGKKKNPTKMSDQDLKRSTDRINAENRYKAALREEKSNKTSYKLGRSALHAGATFAAYYGGTKLMNYVSNGGFFKNQKRNAEIATILAIASGLSAWDIKSGSGSSMVSPDERAYELKNQYTLELDKLSKNPKYN